MQENIPGLVSASEMTYIVSSGALNSTHYPGLVACQPGSGHCSLRIAIFAARRSD